jgi:hypothetical protein
MRGQGGLVDYPWRFVLRPRVARRFWRKTQREFREKVRVSSCCAGLETHAYCSVSDKNFDWRFDPWGLDTWLTFFKYVFYVNGIASPSYPYNLGCGGYSRRLVRWYSHMNDRFDFHVGLGVPIHCPVGGGPRNP